ncbi:MAG: hypothetical protein PHU49_08660 [Syntrophorhabdaceae bacterium]|nr:hypothetical protein [Syntrophorhabdaceae bacterium]
MKILKWILLNSLMAFVALNALYLEKQWAQNLLLFAVWLIVVLCTLAIFSTEAQKEINKQGFAVPQSISTAYDLLFIAALASCGWFVTASAWTWQMLCEVHLRKKQKEQEA